MKHEAQWHKQSDGAVTRIPYRRRADIRVSESGENENGDKLYFIKILPSGEVFQLGREEFFIYNLLDGINSFEAIKAQFHDSFELQLKWAQFNSLLRDLIEMQLVESSGPHAAGAETENAPEAPDVPFSDARPETEADIRAEPQDRTWAQPGSKAISSNKTSAPGHHRLPGQFHLFNPTVLLRAINWLFWPLRYFLWALIPGTLVAGLILLHRFDPLQRDFHLLAATYSGLLPLLVSLVTINLLSRLTQGAVILRFGGKVQSFGVMFIFGLIPRFYVDRDGAHGLNRSGKLWAYGAPLLTRLTLFAVGTFVWATYRQSGTLLPQIALLIGQLGLWSLVITAFPLFRFEGYFWLSSFFDRPRLREQAYQLLGLRVRGHVPEAMSGKDKWVLTLFALGCIIATAAVVILVTLYIAIILEERFQGTGVVVFLSLFAIASLWLLAIRSAVKLLIDKKHPASGGQAVVPVTDEDRAVIPLDRYRDQQVIAGGHHLTFPFEHSDEKRFRVRPLLVWSGIAAALGFVAFLPYEYETGGEFHILPQERIEVRARVSGELVEILVDEGDWVEKGQVIGKVSDWDEERNFVVTVAEKERAEAILRSLQNSPVAEEVELAKRQVESAAARIPFTKAQAERAAKLIKNGSISAAKAEALQSEYDQALTDLAIARANLDLVKTGPMKSEIDAAKAEVARLTEEHRFRAAELERSKIRATATGRIVTSNLRLQRGKFLDVGDLFTEIEDHRIARAEIEVPESDIGQVQVGDNVRLKAWAFSDIELPGKVVAIAPVAEKRNFGLVVRVKTDIPNSSGLLKPNMTGFGKIAGSQMPVWEAYSRMIMRFFRIEIWSWIP